MESLYGVQMRDKGVIVWEGRKCHADWHHHSQHWIRPSAPTTSYKPSCKDVPDGYKERKHSRHNAQLGKIRYHPNPDNGRRREKRQKQLLLYLHPTKLCREQSLLHRSRPWTGEHFPRWSGQEGSGLEEAPILPKGSLGLLWVPVHGSQGVTNLIPFSFLRSLRIS